MLWITATACFSGPAALSNVDSTLEDYVQADDGRYAIEIVTQTSVGPSTVYTIKLTSQVWQGRDWTHWLSVIVPDELRHASKALLIIAGGRNNTNPPDHTRSEARMAAGVAAQTGIVTAVIQQIPNQPLFEGRREDDLIAFTFDQYLNTHDPEWPALLPMVKGAVRAMDGVSEVLAAQHGLNINEFIVTGGSKRGWTTYLTAAVDSRVKAMAPLVFDVLDMEPQIALQQRSYGEVSAMIQEYARHGVIERIDTEAGRQLQRIVDPFAYRDRLTIPKLIMLGTNDPYWVADSASLYVDALPGPTHLHYVANAGHGLGTQAIPTLLAFLHASITGERFPALSWEHSEDGTLEVEWGRMGQARLYEARSPTRDFREAKWTAVALEDTKALTVKPEPPSEGWLAYYVAVEFDAPAETLMPYVLNTPIRVIPETFPH